MPKKHFAIQRVHYPWASPGGAEEIFWGEGRGFDPRGTIETPMKHPFFQMIWSHPIEISKFIFHGCCRFNRKISKIHFLAYWHDRWLGSPPSISHENGHGTIPTTRQRCAFTVTFCANFIGRFRRWMSPGWHSISHASVGPWKSSPQKNHHKLVEEKCWRLFIDFVCVGNWMVLFFGGGKGVIKVMVANSKAPCLADFSIHQSQCKTKCWGTHWIQRDKWRWEWRSQ